MTTLVTGGTGFLGRHLVSQLIAQGRGPVRVLTRRFDLELADLGVELIEGTLSEAADVRRAVEGVTHVYHLAGRVERDPSRAHLMYELHVEGTRRLLDALRDQPVEKIVVASTSGTVGVGTTPDFMGREGSPTTERIVKDWPYYLSKIYAERVCERFITHHKLPIVLMRPTLLLGPGDHNQSSTGDVLLFMRRKVPAALSGGLSFVDVRDTADAFIRAMDRAPAGSTYLLGATNLTLSDFFHRLADITGIPGPRLPLPDSSIALGARLLKRAMNAIGREADLDPVSVEMARHFWYIDASLARQELDWSPRSPDATLRDTVRWIEQHHPEFAPASLPHRTPPPEFVPLETIEFARKLRGE